MLSEEASAHAGGGPCERGRRKTDQDAQPGAIPVIPASRFHMRLKQSYHRDKLGRWEVYATPHHEDLFKQCDGDYAGSNGWVNWISIPRSFGHCLSCTHFSESADCSSRTSLRRL
jgi:hypothetical protein